MDCAKSKIGFGPIRVIFPSTVIRTKKRPIFDLCRAVAELRMLIGHRSQYGGEIPNEVEEHT